MNELTMEETRDLACRYADEQDADSLVELVMGLYMRLTAAERERDEAQQTLASIKQVISRIDKQKHVGGEDCFFGMCDIRELLRGGKP